MSDLLPSDAPPDPDAPTPRDAPASRPFGEDDFWTITRRGCGCVSLLLDGACLLSIATAWCVRDGCAARQERLPAIVQDRPASEESWATPAPRSLPVAPAGRASPTESSSSQ